MLILNYNPITNKRVRTHWIYFVPKRCLNQCYLAPFCVTVRSKIFIGRRNTLGHTIPLLSACMYICYIHLLCQRWYRLGRFFLDICSHIFRCHRRLLYSCTCLFKSRKNEYWEKQIILLEFLQNQFTFYSRWNQNFRIDLHMLQPSVCNHLCPLLYLCPLIPTQPQSLPQVTCQIKVM